MRTHGRAATDADYQTYRRYSGFAGYGGILGWAQPVDVVSSLQPQIFA